MHERYRVISICQDEEQLSSYNVQSFLQSHLFLGNKRVSVCFRLLIIWNNVCWLNAWLDNKMLGNWNNSSRVHVLQQAEFTYLRNNTHERQVVSAHDICRSLVDASSELTLQFLVQDILEDHKSAYAREARWVVYSGCFSWEQNETRILALLLICFKTQSNPSKLSKRTIFWYCKVDGVDAHAGGCSCASGSHPVVFSNHAYAFLHVWC